MSEVTPTSEVEQSPSEGFNPAQTLGGVTDTSSGSRRNPTRAPRRPNTTFTNTPRDFDGVTPKIGGVLALRSENMTKKVNYDIFCEKFGVYIMNDFKGGENVVEVTKNQTIDIISSFEKENKPVELTDEEKNPPLTWKSRRRK